jgi:hypothetical protein
MESAACLHRTESEACDEREVAGDTTPWIGLKVLSIGYPSRKTCPIMRRDGDLAPDDKRDAMPSERPQELRE